MDSSDGSDNSDSISMSHGLDSAARVLMSFASSSLKTADGGDDTPASRTRTADHDDLPVGNDTPASRTQTADRDDLPVGDDTPASRTQTADRDDLSVGDDTPASRTRTADHDDLPVGDDTPASRTQTADHDALPVGDVEHPESLSTISVKEEAQDGCSMDITRTVLQSESTFRTQSHENCNTQSATYRYSPPESGRSPVSSIAKGHLSRTGQCAETQLSTCFQSAMQTHEEHFSDTGQMETQVQSQQHSERSGELSIPVIEQGLHVHLSSAAQTIGESNASCTRQLDPLDQPCGTEDDRNQMEDILDKTWKSSYLDYNVESDDQSDSDSSDDECTDLDSDPDYDKSPEEDYDDDDDDDEDNDDDSDEDEDDEDSDFLPGSKRKRTSSVKIPACTAKRSKNAEHDKGIHENIDLAARMAEIEYIFKANEAANVDKDLNYLNVLLAKDTILRDNSYQRIETQSMVDSEKNERELKEVVKNVLKKHNLLTTSFGPGTSLATAVSYARILCPSRNESQKVDKGSTSSYLSSMKKEALATGSSSVQSHQDVQVLSGRSFLLLQQIAQQETNRRRAVSANMSLKLKPVKSQEGKTILESVLKSMLTEPIEPEPVANQRNSQSRSTLLRGMLMSDLIPLTSPSISSVGGPSNRMKCTDDKGLEVSCNASGNIIPGFSVYVDNAHCEEQSSDADRCENVKSENVFRDLSSAPDHDLPDFKIKSEPHSPNGEFSSPQARSTSIIGRHITEEESVEQSALNVRIKSEPPCDDYLSQSRFCSEFVWKSSTAKESQDIRVQNGSSTLPETTADVPGGRCTPVSAGDSLSRDVDLQMASTNTSGSNLRSLLNTPNSDFTLKAIDSTRNSSQQRNVSRTAHSKLKSKRGRPSIRETLNAKIAQIKQGLDNEQVDNPADDSNSSNSSSHSSAPSPILQNIATKTASVLSKTTPSPRNNTILRCLIDGSSSLCSERPALDRACNTRHKRRPDASLLQEVLKSFQPMVQDILNKTTSSTTLVPNVQPSNQNLNRYGLLETVKTEKLDYMALSTSNVNPGVSDWNYQNNGPIHVATVKTEKQDSLYDSAIQSTVGPGVSDSATHIDLIQNVTSCSQQLLNIIKSVGATKTSESRENVGATIPVSMTGNESKSENATILKAMLNSETPVYSNQGQGHSGDGSQPSVHVNVNTLARKVITPRYILPRCLSSPKTISTHSSTSVDHDIRNNSTGSMEQDDSLSPSVDHPVMNMNTNASNKTDVDRRAWTGQSSGIGTIDSGEPSSAASDSTDVSSVLGVSPYQCRLCGKAYKVSLVLEKHMVEHFGTKPFGCNICPKSYMTIKELVEHTYIHITELSPALVYKCTVCGKVFDTETEHNQHRRSHALTVKQEIKCSQCDATFGTSKLLVDHLCPRRMPVMYACGKCSMMFLIRNEYEHHIRQCQINSLIPCSECETSFVSREELKYHSMRHHDQQGIKCAYCAKRFQFQIHLDKHMLKDHKERFLPPIKASYNDDSADTQPGQMDIHTLLQQVQESAAVPIQCTSGLGNSTSSLTRSSSVVTISDTE